MDIYTAKRLVSLFELDQLTAKVQGAMTLDELFAQIPTVPQHHEGKLCEHNPALTCGKLPGESCEGCPVWKEIDGE